MIGEYYHTRYNVDFRSIRYPGIISNKVMPGGGTTDYAVEIYHHALKYANIDCIMLTRSNPSISLTLSPYMTIYFLLSK